MTQHRTEHRAQKMAQPRKKAQAPPVPTAERATPTRNGPRDAMAEVKPRAPPARGVSGWVLIGLSRLTA